MRCPYCNGLVVFDQERVEFTCAICERAVDALEWPYPQEYMQTVYMTRVAAKAAKAQEVIRRYVGENAVVTLSGKDSEVALHLVTSAGVSIDVIIATHVARWRLPQKVIEELRAFAETLNVRRVVIYDEPWDVHQSLFRLVGRVYGYGVIVTGIRRGTNRNHISTVERLLVEPGRYVKLVNPVFGWSADEVWSYIFYHKLPVFTPYRIGVMPDASLQHIVL
ncbi:MAG: hypothetical protein ACO2PN_09765 [Pyrobaculum sp.]|jgi:3'-phosphoadenosine 5'-phosphosulfate sulfotransferase (PAPS reductase)/FAD synthetase